MFQLTTLRVLKIQFLFIWLAFVSTSAWAQSVAERLTVSPGWLIYTPSGDYDYRYGPSIMLNADDSIEAWFASPGGKNSEDFMEWDWIRHKRSTDGGKTWSEEKIVLAPTPHSRDRMSVCDPAVIQFDGWYYLGVTAVEDAQGMDNEIFIARSRSASGPFEKWNGEGWGGDRPMPLIAFRNPPDVWGAGEPSFVLKDDTLFVYYTILSRDDKGTSTCETWVATAPARDENWPKGITGHRLAWSRETNEDSVDVKYCDQLSRFIGISTASRMGPEAHILLRESTDGIHWSAPTKITENVKPWSHNCGISGTPDGHLDLTRQNFIGYAFSTEPKVNWGVWHTILHPVTIRP